MSDRVFRFSSFQ